MDAKRRFNAPRPLLPPPHSYFTLLRRNRDELHSGSIPLPQGKAINWDLYCQQRMRIKQEVEKKRSESVNRKCVVFYHDNAKPHTFLAIRQILREFGWEVLMHLPLTDIALNLHSQIFTCFSLFRIP
ncbi:Histone-lysine N-methyltransferase SETMAR [Eumeta japonica]|uniref:Histone-lysine N-methyltransferase SETMAR n=1 Tax=Eumeta variegata TaxID=151549 RepID=A0A4C1Y249_EUMVA|nr:Histone-lysine N-methyltransferase SETMAR [Eumeta japonica]